jgi:hypothetical protein
MTLTIHDGSTPPSLPLAESSETKSYRACSPDLFKRLSETGDTNALVAECARVPSIREAAQAALEPLQARSRGCGAKGVARLVVPLATLYGLADRSEEEWATYWSFYIAALGSLPYEALEQAVAQYVKQGEFFPKPAALYKLAEPYAERVRIAAWRAKRIAEHRPDAKPHMTAAERADMRAKLSELAASIGSRRVA